MLMRLPVVLLESELFTQLAWINWIALKDKLNIDWWKRQMATWEQTSVGPLAGILSFYFPGHNSNHQNSPPAGKLWPPIWWILSHLYNIKPIENSFETTSIFRLFNCSPLFFLFSQTYVANFNKSTSVIVLKLSPSLVRTTEFDWPAWSMWLIWSSHENLEFI